MKRTWIIFLAAAFLVAGCRRPVARPEAPHPRVVSFSPAITDILFDMGLGDHVVGVTNHCILPPGQRRVEVGGALRVDDEAILALTPDVLATQIKTDAFQSVRRINPDIKIEYFTMESLDDIAAAIERLGRIVGRGDLAAKAKDRFKKRLEAIRRSVAGKAKPRVLFIEAGQAPFVAGKGTFIDEMITLAGGVNAADPGRPHQPWRTMDIEGVMAAAPDVLICRAKPLRRQATRNYWLSVPNLPAAGNKKVFVVTDRRWTIPSTRSAGFAEKLAEMIHAAGADKGQGS